MYVPRYVGGEREKKRETERKRERKEKNRECFNLSSSSSSSFPQNNKDKGVISKYGRGTRRQGDLDRNLVVSIFYYNSTNLLLPLTSLTYLPIKTTHYLSIFFEKAKFNLGPCRRPIHLGGTSTGGKVYRRSGRVLQSPRSWRVPLRNRRVARVGGFSLIW